MDGSVRAACIRRLSESILLLPLSHSLSCVASLLLPPAVVLLVDRPGIPSRRSCMAGFPAEPQDGRIDAAGQTHRCARLIAYVQDAPCIFLPDLSSEERSPREPQARVPFCLAFSPLSLLPSSSSASAGQSFLS